MNKVSGHPDVYTGLSVRSAQKQKAFSQGLPSATDPKILQGWNVIFAKIQMGCLDLVRVSFVSVCFYSTYDSLKCPDV